MVALKYISIIWAVAFSLIIFVILFESRYSKKKTQVLSLSLMGPLVVLNFVLFIIVGVEAYLKLLIPLCSLPSFVFFWIMAKYRDGRFFFTFCMADTIGLEILYITNIIDYYVPGDSYLVMFMLRLIAYPLLTYYILKKIRPIYLEVQKYTKKGWYSYALIGAIFYISMTLSVGYPTMVTERPEYLPALILMFILMPMLYLNILNTLRNQQMMYEMMEQDDILTLQVSNLKGRMEEFSAADERFRMERNNFRHKMQTIAGMIDKQQYDELHKLVIEYDESIKETRLKRYCTNAVLDAMFSSYLQKAESIGIKVSTKIVLPDVLPVNESELATVIANALENAINACGKIDVNERYIDVHAITEPRFMIQVSNSFDGKVELDENGMPINNHEEHGFGTRSIVAFCEKHGAFYEFKIDDKDFSLRIVF